ncbi:MAG: hypothetical protein IH587_09105, partial [Anaerolineae bacterium]|nr:hypothetical protein [Anaerolineae bacterium]
MPANQSIAQIRSQVDLPPRRSLWQDVVRRFLRHRIGMIGFVITLI